MPSNNAFKQSTIIKKTPKVYNSCWISIQEKKNSVDFLPFLQRYCVMVKPVKTSRKTNRESDFLFTKMGVI